MLAKKQSGFTLVEIAVVLVIVGLLVGSFIGTFVSRVDATRRDNTKSELLDIKQVLIAYAFSQAPNVYLPCPDTDVPPDGFENRLAGACTPGGALGTLPWITLGLGREDAWATHYRYWVNDAYAINTGFDLASDDAGGGNATVQTRVNDVPANMVTNAVAVIFSHGKNSLGGLALQASIKTQFLLREGMMKTKMVMAIRYIWPGHQVRKDLQQRGVYSMILSYG